MSRAAHAAMRALKSQDELANVTFSPAINSPILSDTSTRQTIVLPLLAGASKHRDRVKVARLRALAGQWLGKNVVGVSCAINDSMHTPCRVIPAFCYPQSRNSFGWGSIGSLLFGKRCRFD